MDEPCDRRTSDGVTNHRIWQEFHMVLWDSAWFYAILRIMVSYDYKWISKQVSTRFGLVPLYSIWFYGHSFVFDLFPRVSIAFFCILSGPVPCFVILLYSRYLVTNSAYKRRFLPPLSLSFLFFLHQTIPAGSIGDNYNQYYDDQSILSSLFFSRIPYRKFTG